MYMYIGQKVCLLHVGSGIYSRLHCTIDQLICTFRVGKCYEICSSVMWCYHMSVCTYVHTAAQLVPVFISYVFLQVCGSGSLVFCLINSPWCFIHTCIHALCMYMHTHVHTQLVQLSTDFSHMFSSHHLWVFPFPSSLYRCGCFHFRHPYCLQRKGPQIQSSSQANSWKCVERTHTE